MKLRKVVEMVDEVYRDGDVEVEPPARTAVVAAVIENPWDGQGFVADLGPIIARVSPQLGALLAPRVVALLDRPVEAYGKGAVVGLGGELEHASGIIHTLQFGDPLREAVSGSSLLPALEKRAAGGASFDIPLKHITDATIRSHHQSVEVRIADAPAADEIIIALAASAQGRPHARLAPLSSETN